MKYLMYISILLFGMLGASSCTQEETMGQSSSDIFTLKVDVDGTKKATRTINGVTPESNEGVMSNLYIFFYEQGVDNSPKVSCLETNLETTDWSKKIAKSEFESGKIYDVYALANVPSDIATQLVNGISKNVLTALTENLMARTVSTPNISFSTYTAGAFSFAKLKNNTYTISLTRTVARLDMIIDTTAVTANWTLASIKVSNESTSTKYFSGGTHTPARSVEDKDAFVNKDNKRYYYVYEDQSNTIGLTFNLESKAECKTRTYTAKVPVPVARNKVYTLNIKLEELVDDPVTIDCVMGDWTSVGVDVDIANVYLDLPSDTVELSRLGSGQLYFKSNAESVTVTWKDKNGLLVNLSKGPLKVIYPTDALDNYKIDFSMLLAEPMATEDTITLSVGNLVKKVEVIKPVPYYFMETSILPMDNYPNEIKKYNYDVDKDFEIKTHIVSDLDAELYYVINCTKRINDDGSQTPYVYNVHKGFLPANTEKVTNVMEAVSKFISKGLFEYEVVLFYGDNVGASVAKRRMFYIEKLN